MNSLVLQWRLDLAAFAFAAFLAAWAAARFSPAKTSSAPSRRVLVGAICVLIVVCGTLMEATAHLERSRIREALLHYAPAYARMTASEGLEHIQLDTAADDPRYLGLIELQKQWLQTNTKLGDIYVFARKADGSVVLWVDSETDYDRNGAYEGEREGRTAIGEPYPANDKILGAFEGRNTFADTPYTDKWGTWVSAFSPIRDVSGRVIGVLGVDYDAAAWTRTILAGRLVVIVLGLTALGAVIAAYYLRRHSTVILVLLAGTVLSGVAAWTIHVREYEKLGSGFNQAAGERINTFVSMLDHHLHALGAIESFYAASTHVSREEFAAFTKNFLVKDEEILNLQWVPCVTAADRAKAEAAAGEDGAAGFRIKELDGRGRLVTASSRQDHYPVYYIEPQDKNRLALGYDHGSDPARRKAIEKMLATGKRVVTPGIVKEDDAQKTESAVLILNPVYEQVPGESASGAERKLQGIAAGVYDIAALLETALKSFEPAGLQFVLKDVTPGSAGPILAVQDTGEPIADIGSVAKVMEAGWGAARQFQFCDRTWEVQAVPSRVPRASADAAAWAALAAGLLLTAAFAAYLRVLIRTSERNEKVAAESRKAAEALRASEERTRSIIQTANDAFITINSRGDIEDWNSRAESVFGWKRDEVIGRSLSTAIVPEKYREAHREGMKKYLRTGEGPVLNNRIEISAVHRDGHEFPIELTIWPVRRGSEVIFSAFIHDITERKEAQERIRKNERYIQLLQDITSASNEASSSAEAMRSALRKVCELMGWPVGHVYEVRGGKALVSSGIWYLSAGSDFENFKKISSEMTFEPGVGLPGRVWASGKPVWVRDVLQDPNFPRAKAAKDIRVKAGMGFPVMNKERVVAVLEFFSTQTEEESERVLDVMTQVGNQLGRVVEREEAQLLLTEALEKTRKANDELKRTQGQLIQADRLSAIGQLAAGVAHEINNPVGFVNSNLSTLKKYAAALIRYQEAVSRLIDAARSGQKPDAVLALAEEALALGGQIKIGFILSDMEPLVAESQSGLDRVKKIVMDLKTFTRADSKEGMDLGDLNAVLEGAVNVVWNEIKYKAQVVKEFGDLPKVYCNAQQLGQVFINILVNAAQAMKDAGTITVRTYVKDEHVCADIEDTGTGIPADVIDHIFDPFFTTKEVGQGTGLGLSISYDIIKKHGGRMDVATQIGKGTRFTIHLPLSSCPMPSPPK
jgi:PAS domain S-box-containing protein